MNHFHVMASTVSLISDPLGVIQTSKQSSKIIANFMRLGWVQYFYIVYICI